MRGVWRRSSDRPRWRVEAALGLLMLPLTLIPIYLYMTRTDDGYLMYLHGRYAVLPPGTKQLDSATAQLAGAAVREPIHGVPVLVYHGIGRSTGDVDDRRYLVTRDNFAEQMRALTGAGFSAITTDDLALYLRSRDSSLLPRKPVLITFDDGRTDAMVQADPILRDTGMRATMFVIGRAASEPSFYYQDWGDLRGFVASGRWELGNHTVDLHQSHDDVRGRPPVSALARPERDESLAAFEARIAADVDRAQNLLRQEGSGNPVAFAYPFGDWGQHARVPGVPAAIERVLTERFALAFDQDGQSGWRFALPGDDPLHIHRLQMQNWNGAEFLDRLAAAEELSETAFRERGLDLGYSPDRLFAAAVKQACARPQETPIRATPALEPKAVALTFDDGPSAYTPQVLDVLDDYGAKATFFVVGRRLQGRDTVLERMLVEGHEIANHTWSHSHAKEISRSALSRELRVTSARIASAVPTKPCLTRPPYNEGVARHADVGHSLGMSTALWSVDPRDFELRSAWRIANRVLKQVDSGDIVLLHDGGADRWATVQALPLILEGLDERGLSAVTVSELVEDDG
jgi:peptidoglycan/xylan/chitin deacetylase (PgdA/CDA1 family)